MEKHKTTSVYPILILLAMLFIGIAGHAQTYTFTGPGDWDEAAKWSPTPSSDFLAGIIEIGGYNIEINDTCKVNDSSLLINNAGEIVVKTGATLDIWGNVAFNHNLFKVGVESGGFFVVHGNVSVATAISLSIDVDGGYFSVDGNFDQQGTISDGLNNNPHVYITGTETGPYFDCTDPSLYVPENGTCNYGNRAAIAINETIAIRKLLLGTLAIGFTPTPTQPLCNGGSDGSITVQGTGGSHSYQYSIDNTNWFPDGSYTAESHTFSNLSVGDHPLYVRDDEGTESFAPVTLGEPNVLTHTVTGDPYFCNPNTGAFTVNVSGGTPPFTVNVNGVDCTGVLTEYSIDYSGKAAGTYIVNVTDANGCASTSNPQSFTVVVDVASPVCDSYPADLHIPIVTFDGYTSVIGPITPEPVIYNNTKPLDPDTLVYSFSSLNFETIKIDVKVSQTEAAGLWNNNDEISFLIDYDLDWTGDHQIINDVSRWTGEYAEEGDTQDGNTTATGFVGGAKTLPPGANGKNLVYLFVVYKTDDPAKQYEIALADITITGKSITNTITTAIGGEPVNCSDILSSATVTPVDGDVTWECNTASNREFWFERTWVVTDACGNGNTTADRVQRIMVGTPPTITDPADLTFDFCHNQNVKIDIPTFSDNCIASISWEVTSGTGASPSSGDPDAADTQIILAFAQPEGPGNLTYTITWTVTDAAGFSASTTQDVTILAPISITLDPANANFCTGEAAKFTITVTGGTGVYDHSTVGITPAIDGVWSWSGNQGTFITSGLVLEVTENITVSISDSNTAGVIGECASGDIVFENNVDYFIHEKISTNVITRD